MLPEIDPNQPITLDLETCDPELNYTAPGYISKVGFVAGIAVRAREGSWYVPIHHAEGENYNEREVVAWLNRVCSADTDKVFHNGQYDIGWLKYIGVQLHGRIFDTMLAAPLLDENRYSYQLDALGKSYFGEGKFEESLKAAVADKFNSVKTHKTRIRLREIVNGIPQTFAEKERVSQFYDLWPKEVQDRYEVMGYEQDKKGHTEFKVPCIREKDVKSLLWAVDPAEMGTYPIQDVNLTYKLYELFKPELEKQNLTNLMALENELLLPLLEMRERGVRIDMDKAKELDDLYTKQIDNLQQSLNRLAGFEVDVNIDADLIKICDTFGLDYAKTDKGNPCFSAEKVPKDDLGMFNLVLEIRKYFKARDTYIRGYIFGSTIDGWLHGQYNQLKSDDAGTVTGRLSSSCIAEGTLISVPGGYKKIEDVQAGEQVYCYKEDGTLTISTVLNKLDKGIKDCVKIKWQSSGDMSTGELICTPDHLIKTKYKGWLRADKLKRYDKMFHLRRVKQSNGRIRLYGTNSYMETEEQCIKREWFKAPSNLHIHHINKDKSDNRLENFAIMTHAEHCSLHGKGNTHWQHLLTCPRVVKKGKENPHYKHYSAQELEDMLRTAKGRLTKVPMDFDTYKKHCAEEGFDYKKVASEYQNNYKELNVEEVLGALHKHNGSIVKARKELKVGYINFKRFCVENKIAYNHTVTSVTPCGKKHVWDLEVEEHHNFIANEICVHNCPNMQNLPNPKSSQIGKDIRGLFLPDNDDEEWLSMDYSGQEPKMLVHTVIALNKWMQRRFPDAKGDLVPGASIAMTEEFRGRSADFHTATATICMKKEFELEHKVPTPEELKEAAKKFRPKAKSIGLGVMYGSGNKKVAEELTKKGFPMTTEDAGMVRQSIYEGVPFLKYISDYLMKKAKDRGYIKTILGRRGRFDIWECPVYNEDMKKKIGTANFGFKTSEDAWKWYNENNKKYDGEIGRPQRAMAYKALNKYIQGSSADQTKTAMVHLYKRNNLELSALDIYYRRIKDFIPPNFKTQVHDEINISKTKDEKAEWYQDIMENCIPLEVEAVADPVVCAKWSDAK